MEVVFHGLSELVPCPSLCLSNHLSHMALGLLVPISCFWSPTGQKHPIGLLLQPDSSVEAPPHRTLHQVFPADPQDLFGSARSDRHPPPTSEPTHHQIVLWTIHDEHRNPITKHHSDSEREGHAPNHTPPGLTVIANVSIEVPQQNKGVPRRGSLQYPLQGLQKGWGPTFPLRAVPCRAPWVKAQPPDTRQHAPPRDLAPDWGPSDPRPGEGTLFTSMLLNAIQLFGANLDDYLHLLLPPIVKLFDAPDVPLQARKVALETLDRLTESLDFTDYASRIIHPIVRTLDSTPELRSTAMDTLSSLVFQLGKKYQIFIPMVNKVMLKHRINHQRYDILICRIVKGYTLAEEEEDPLIFQHRQIRGNQGDALVSGPVEPGPMKKLHVSTTALQKVRWHSWQFPFS
ncbi:hypothetical protein ILYODFUR_016271 [Ilyodon furcidens]|uniref:Uncharacterized protein n=1 Tax=Ilyodon furcidens TaxID=33524 RepID=A0ABV0TCB3_9TELE